MAGNTPGRPKKPRFRPWKGIPPEMMRVARDRTDYLAESHPLAVQPYRTALANAYMQGLADAVEAMKEHQP